MSMIEVRATMSFETFRAGRLYQVDGTDSRVQALIYGRYLSVVHSPEPSVVDSSGLVPGADTDLGSGVKAVKKRAPAKKAVADGQGSDLRGPGDPVHPGENVASRVPDLSADS